MLWEPSTKQGYLRCRKHDSEFRIPDPCLQCTALEGESFLAAASAEPEMQQYVHNLPSLHEHEEWFNDVSKRADDWSEALLNSGEYGPGSKLMAEAIKARRAATELARRREDWALVYKLESQWREITGVRLAAKTSGGSASAKQLTTKTSEG